MRVNLQFLVREFNLSSIDKHFLMLPSGPGGGHEATFVRRQTLVSEYLNSTALGEQAGAAGDVES